MSTGDCAIELLLLLYPDELLLINCAEGCCCCCCCCGLMSAELMDIELAIGVNGGVGLPGIGECC